MKKYLLYSFFQAEHRIEQLRKATDRIQKEIEEVTEREHELRNVGSIKTTSHETVDSKVYFSSNICKNE